MKVITLWQPWASWIRLGWKTIETRTHNRFRSLEHQRIAIHAGLRYDRDARRLAEQYLSDDQLDENENDFWMARQPHGAIICTVYVERVAACTPDNASHALIECTVTQRWGLHLRDIYQLRPIYCKGQRGIWELDL